MHPVTPAGVLAGRDDELALLNGLLRDLARGSGSAVLIEGEPGIGKTALIRAALGFPPPVLRVRGCRPLPDDLRHALDAIHLS
jgi:Mg-chelatase subunit ChlI